MEWFSSLDPFWVWLAVGLFLFAAEILVPGFFLMWLAGAALATSVVAFIMPGAIPLQVTVFAVLSIVAVFIGRNYFRSNPILEADPKMNRRGMRLAGEIATVVSPIDGGTGRVKHGDSEWLAKGCDAAVGDKVRISGSDGAVLIVEPL
ncbi:NfeD family protein [Qipengyuania sphaerica]|uniref:NfeD family protein n=1 Tax=Qipengyuania sphaerica TaxID=2867243 RepID=UPI001C87DFE0|nr:NfeD family protein [Qipengyuania sphaerica]MBX7539562.1 NfeD family protein [Qipengyuania sphaerica]